MNRVASNSSKDRRTSGSSAVDVVYMSMAKRECALWITQNTRQQDIDQARLIEWSLVLNGVPAEKRDYFANLASKPSWHIVESTSKYAKCHAERNIQQVLDIYRKSDPETDDEFHRDQNAIELLGILRSTKGLLLVLGTPDQQFRRRLQALAPKQQLLVIGDKGEAELHRSGSSDVATFLLQDFWRELRQRIDSDKIGNRLNLKDAPDFEFDIGWVDKLGPGLKLLTAKDIQHNRVVNQEDFDSFLSGDFNLNAFGAGASADRGTFARIRSKDGLIQRIDPVKHICNIVKELDRTETVPDVAMKSVIVFSEMGAGISTVLRQTAVELSRYGYPTIISNPRPEEIKAESLLQFIIDIQDNWARCNDGKGTSSGSLPVCILLDSDAEESTKKSKLVNLLSRDLNRKVVLVRVLQRSREEVDKAEEKIQIVANTSKEEILKIGKHLRNFCSERELQEIPSAPEWELYYSGFSRKFQNHANVKNQTSEYTPHLFLVAIHPFVKERVRDERSLSRYLYGSCESIGDEKVRRLVELVAEAGFYGISLPFECLIKQKIYELYLSRKNSNSKDDERVFDSFVTWNRYKHFDSSSWSLYARHPAICGMLLNMTAPRYASAPYTNLAELLNNLTGSYADTWLCEAVASGVGRWLGNAEQEFGIEYETPRQRASRELFEAMPETIVMGSRFICHQYARFHIHVLRTCRRKLENPQSTILTIDELVFIAKERLQQANQFVDQALDICNSGEKISNVLTSLGSATGRLADALRKFDQDTARDLDKNAIRLGTQAVSSDIANGHALHSVITNLQNSILSGMNTLEVDLKYFLKAEDYLQNLCSLHANMQWRNSDEIDAELSISQLLKNQNKTAGIVKQNFQEHELVLRNRISLFIVHMRTILKGKTLRDGFLDKNSTEDLRQLRADIETYRDRNAMELSILYRLYLEDYETRFDFETRLQIIEDIIKRDLEYSEVFMHDRAALLCQVGEFGSAREVFCKIKELRSTDPGKWFWKNEKILIDNSTNPVCAKKVVVTVTDQIGGWGSLDGESGNFVKIQPRQFGNISKNLPIECYLKFGLTNLQAIDKRMAKQNMLALDVDADV